MVGKLNYSKWDALELSDDSDIEVHPNVDKKSFIRWKQRDIHEKREERKHEVANLKAEKSINETLSPRLDDMFVQTQKEGHAFYSREVSRLSAGRADRGNKDGPEGPTPDDMMLSLLLQINEESSVKGKKDSLLDEALLEKLKEHQSKLATRQKQVINEINRIEEEESRKITSEGIREGWSSGYINKAEDEPKPKAKAAKETSIETLNPQAAAAASSSSSNEDDEDLPQLLPSMAAFAKLPSCLPNLPVSASTLPSNFSPIRDVKTEPFDTALEYLSQHKELIKEETNTTDALLVEAFQAEMRGEQRLARRCVEKGLLVQYCNKLGRDGVNLFFKRMRESAGKAAVVYFNDVLSTYNRISERCKALQAEEKAGNGGDTAGEGQEQIQLVAEDPDTVISFDVPDGPPPEQIELDEELATRMDVDQVRAILQSRWETFNAFPATFKLALQSRSLAEVNKCLGAMPVVEAEQIVGALDRAGILNFSSSEVRDETGKSATTTTTTAAGEGTESVTV